jgi:hypothetical protein
MGRRLEDCVQRGTLLVPLVLLSGVALAQVDESDMTIASTRDGGGRLVVEFDFSTVVRTAFAGSVGPLRTYSGTDPGFAARGESRAGGPYALRPETEIRVELLANDPARVVLKVRDVVLAHPGEVATLGVARRLHHHPEFQLLLDADAGVFGESTLSFRLTTPSPRYAASRAYVLTVSNGILRPVRWSTTRYDAESLRCRRGLLRRMWKHLDAVATGLRTCPAAGACAGGVAECDDPAGVAAVREGLARGRLVLRDALLRRCGPEGSGDHDAEELLAYIGLASCRVSAVMAHAATGGGRCGVVAGEQAWQFMRTKGRRLAACLRRQETLTARLMSSGPSSPRPVEVACAPGRGYGSDADSLLGRVRRARRRAAAAIGRGCGAATPPDLLAAAACAVDDIASAAHLDAKSALGQLRARPSQGGRPLSDYFPCLRGGHEHVHIDEPPDEHGHGHAHAQEVE